jgi:fatty-acid desaturase
MEQGGDMFAKRSYETAMSDYSSPSFVRALTPTGVGWHTRKMAVPACARSSRSWYLLLLVQQYNPLAALPTRPPIRQVGFSR